MTNPFPPEVISAITRHMNDDHAADTLVICRGVGRRPEAIAARMDHFDATGADFTITVAGAEETLRLDWSRPLSQRAEVRPEIVAMFHASRERLDGGED